GQLWRACDMVRERRGDSHRNAWLGAGLDGAEVNVLTDAWRGPQFNGTTNTWPAEELAAATARLEVRGLVAGDAITDSGRALREEIEVATDRQDGPVVEQLGADAPELLELLTPWARAVVSGVG
ncbi:MAG: helix-turn-helix domain-containing protein, partial [Acidimicrobiia bacterium]